MRSIAKLMQDWQFTGPDGKTTLVELPHTWNAKDGQDGGNDYWRGTCTYSTTFAAPAFDAASQEVWLQFEGVNSSAKVLLNGRNICTHDGGYSTFRVHVSDLLVCTRQSFVVVNVISPDRPAESADTRAAQYAVKVTNRIVQKYKGTLTTESQNGFFAVKIIFPQGK